MNYKKISIFFLFFVLLISTFSTLASYDESPPADPTGILIFDTSANSDPDVTSNTGGGGQTICETENGTIIVGHVIKGAHGNSNAGIGYQHCSFDGGETWHTKDQPHSRDWYNDGGNSNYCHWEELITTQNGTVIAVYGVFDKSTGNRQGSRYCKSYDNGITWTDLEYINASDTNAIRYASDLIFDQHGNLLLIEGDEVSKELYRSTDNGESWSLWSDLGNSNFFYGDLCLMDNGTILYTGYYQPNDKYIYLMFSEDDGKTWTTARTDYLDGYCIREPETAHVGDHYFLWGRSGGTNGACTDCDQFILYESSDGTDFSFAKWLDTSNQCRGQYYSSSEIIDEPENTDTEKILICYSKDYSCATRYTDEYIFWLENITNASATTDETNTDIIFNSINNLSNNSFLTSDIYRFNWSYNSSASYYELQVSNDSGFTDVFLTLSDVNESNYGVNYTEYVNSNYVIFILPNTYRKSWYQDYYCRVRPVEYV